MDFKVEKDEPYTYNRLYSMNIKGKGGLQELVVKNKIFKGVSKLKKNEYIHDIMASIWWKKYGDGTEYPLQIKNRIIKSKILKESLTEQQKLRNQINDLEQLIRDKDSKLKEEKKENLNIELPDLIIKSNISNNENLSEIDNIKVEELEKIDEIPYTKDMITYKEKEHKNIDVGHTIVNIYCDGNYNKDLSIPQLIVRRALNSNNLSLYQQQELIDILKINKI